MGKKRIAVVGAGYLGKFHAEKYANHPQADLVAVCDLNREVAGSIAEKHGAAPVFDHKELLGKVDAVSVVVPTSEHFAVTRDFLRAGVDVLLEKPMTTTLEEADALIGLAEKEGLILQVGHLERFNPAVKALKGKIQSPKFMEAHRLALFKPRATDVSVVLDLMIHDIDIILNFVTQPITEVRAAGAGVISDHVDIANARLEFMGGCVANVTASRVSMKNQRKIRIFQKESYVSVDFAERAIVMVHPGTGPEGPIPGAKVETMSFEQGDALADEIAAFMESIQTRNTPEVSGQAGREALRVALIIMDQIRKSTGLKAF